MLLDRGSERTHLHVLTAPLARTDNRITLITNREKAARHKRERAELAEYRRRYGGLDAQTK